MIVEDLIGAVRAQAKDAVPGNYKRDDAYIAGKIGDALGLLFDARPDAFMLDSVLLEPPAVDSVADEVPVAGKFKAAVVLATAALLLGENVTDKASVEASNGLFNKFYSWLGVGGAS